MNIINKSYTHNEFDTNFNNFLKLTLLYRYPSIASIFKEFSLSLVQSKPHSFPDCNPIATDPGVNNAKNTENKGLIVFIHGLNSSPDTGRTLYKKEIENQTNGEFEVWVPVVPKRGNCSLEEAAEPILEMVKKYIETNPGKPIQLIGHSNGGRIAAYVETHLRDKKVDMRVTGIAGVFFGSDLITSYKKTGTAYLFLCPSILRDLPTGSKKSKELINEMRKEVTIGSREYTFYTTIDDIAIPNFTSCLPNIKQNEKCHVLIGCGHSDIQKVVCEREVKKVIAFLKEHENMNLTSTSKEHKTIKIPMVHSFYNEALVNEAIISA